ncbi:MAG: putative porin [Cytophagaceae bacterium]|nr:putative porin [Cytophagaceae bacterium]MDW8456581.1 putative porin [Cytophagaceae bacterium]
MVTLQTAVQCLCFNSSILQKYALWCGLILYSYAQHAQILDDSTKLKYGPTTTKYFYEQDVEENRIQYYNVDTSLLNFHHFEYNYLNGQFYQDLGNYGSALYLLKIPDAPRIGKNYGYNSFDPYAYNPKNIKYYNTLSPYTDIKYIQGGLGQQDIEAQHTRNISRRWNSGIQFRRMVSSKIYGVSQRREAQCSHYSFVAHTNYHTKNRRYNVLMNFSIFQHTFYETGGIFDADRGLTQDDMFEYRLESPNLYSVSNTRNRKNFLRSIDRRSQYHLYHQANLTNDSTIQLFHSFDYLKMLNRYDDIFLNRNKNFYPNIFFDNTQTSDYSRYALFENTGGIKGRKNFFYYKAYLRRKDFSRTLEGYTNLYERRVYAENFLGGSIKITPKDSMYVHVKAEYMPARDYHYSAEFSLKKIFFKYTGISYSPTLMQSEYAGNHFIWSNNFRNTQMQKLQTQATLKSKKIFFKPGIEYALLHSFVYFNSFAVPEQMNELIRVFCINTHYKIEFKPLCIEGQVSYNQLHGEDVLRIPEITSVSRVYLYGFLAKKALLLQAGTEVFWNSSYFANYYMPPTQAYYINNDFLVQSYPLVNVYINAKVKRTLFLLKLSHANQNMFAAGYFTTPFYTGLPRTFTFGLRWMFFD